MHRRGNEQPALTLRRLHQITGERRAFEDVARTILINSITLLDPGPRAKFAAPPVLR
jgi:hypothetical protein